MSGLRLVLVTERFWPQADELALLLSDWALELAAQGARLTVLTPRWQSDWPTWINYEAVRVFRLAHPGRSPWSTLRYVYSISRWLRTHAAEFDLVCVSQLRYEAHAALRCARGRFPVALRAERAGLSGDCHWQLDALFGRHIKRRTMEAAALIATSPAIERELVAAGYPRDRIHLVFNGTLPPPERTPQARQAARRALAEAHAVLSLPESAPLVVAVGRLDESKGWDALLEAWSVVVGRHPQARLWIIGEGPERGQVARRIEALEIKPWVTLPGSFDDLEEIFLAADLFVSASLEEGTSPALLAALAAGLPVVATDIPGNRAVIEPQQQGLLVPVEDSRPLAEALLRLVGDQPLGERLGAAARRRAEEQFSLERMARKHLALFDELVAAAAGARRQG